MITTTTADPDLTLLKNTFCIGFPCKLSDKKKGRGPCRPCGSWKLSYFWLLFFITHVVYYYFYLLKYHDSVLLPVQISCQGVKLYSIKGFSRLLCPW